MKAVILAAGKGTRMLPLSEKIPKVMIEVNGRPWMDYLIEEIKKAGIEEIAIVVEYKKEVIENYYDFPMIETQGMNGTGDIAKVQEFTKNEDFLLLYGDNLWKAEDIKKLKEMEGNAIVSTTTETPEKYGILKVENGKLVDFVEKPKEFIGNQMNTGMYKFTKEVFEKIKDLKLSVRGELELVDVFKDLNMSVVNVDFWIDLGCKEDIEKASKILSHGF